MKIHKATPWMLVATAFLMGAIVGLFWTEVESTRRYRDRLDSLNGTLDQIGPQGEK